MTGNNNAISEHRLDAEPDLRQPAVHAAPSNNSSSGAATAREAARLLQLLQGLSACIAYRPPTVMEPQLAHPTIDRQRPTLLLAACRLPAPWPLLCWTGGTTLQRCKSSIWRQRATVPLCNIGLIGAAWQAD